MSKEESPSAAEVRRAAQLVETILPDKHTRAQLLELFAQSIEEAHRHNPSSWCTTLPANRHIVRLNVGRYVAFDLAGDSVTLITDDSIFQPGNPPTDLGEIENGTISSLPGTTWRRFRGEGFPRAWPQLRESHFAAIQGAAKAVARTPYYVFHSPALLQYVEDATAKALPTPDYPIVIFSAHRIAQLLKLLRGTYPDWQDFSHKPFVKDEIAYKRAASEKAKKLLAKDELQSLLEADQYSEFIDRLKKVAQSTNLLYLRVPSTSDIDILLQDSLDQQGFCRHFFDLVHGEGETEERLASYLEWVERQGLSSRWTFPTYYLFLLHPDAEIFVKPSRSKRFLAEIDADEEIGSKPSPDKYLFFRQIAYELKEELSERGAKDLIDIQSFMWVTGIRDRGYWKVAPGENAKDWEEWRNGGFIAIGWDELGDISGLSRSEFETRRDGLVAELEGWTKQGANQVWRFANQIKEGDRIVANRGTNEVVGIGTVSGPYYYVPEGRQRHRLPVVWDDTRVRPVDEKGWKRTLVNLRRADFERVAKPLPPADTLFNQRTFALLNGIHAKPTLDYYSEHQEEFKTHVEAPLEQLLIEVAGRLPESLRSVLETQKPLFSWFPRNDFGEGSAWDCYWAAYHPRGGKRTDDAQLFVQLERDHLEFGFRIGNYGGNANDRFPQNCREHRAILMEKLADLLSDSRLRFGDDAGGNAPDWTTWLANPSAAGFRVGVPLTPEQCVARSRGELVENVARIFQGLFPLVLLATSDDPLADLESYLNPGEPKLPNPVYPLPQWSTETGFDVETLERWVRAINRKGQAVLYGPPGTGKTYIAEKLAAHLIGGGTGFSELVQFHPAYAYEDFIQGIRPRTAAEGGLSYDLKKGRFIDFCRRARREYPYPCVLIIDEINRADLARVFGELMYLLEYRDRDVPLAGGDTLRIPENVRIIGTMNTADRSIALVDHALRRRFAFLALHPRPEVLTRFHERQQTGFNPSGLNSVLEKVNEAIGDPNYALGITFFLNTDIEANIADIWMMEIEPYLEEYFFDQPAKRDQFRWEKVRSEILK